MHGQPLYDIYHKIGMVIHIFDDDLLCYIHKQVLYNGIDGSSDNNVQV